MTKEEIITNSVNAIEVTFLNPAVNYYHFEKSNDTNICYISNHFALDDLQNTFHEFKKGKAQILLLNNLISSKFKLTNHEKSKWAIILIATSHQKKIPLFQINNIEIKNGCLYEFESKELACEYLQTIPIYIKLIVLCSDSFITSSV